jgi:hypothetical protein
VSKKYLKVQNKQNDNFSCGSVWTIRDIKGETQTQIGCEQGAEENI